jgi:class 3 adenylate cyclase
VIRSLRQRLFLFLVLPVVGLLVAMGLFGFFYARGIMVDQWREAALLKLERAAQSVDARLARPLERIKLLQRTAETERGYGLQAWILDRIREQDGVAGVAVEWADGRRPALPRGGRGRGGGPGGPGDEMAQVRRTRVAEIAAPRYDTDAEGETVSLVSLLEDEEGGLLGRLRVEVRFDHLMQDIRSSGWWQSDTGYLVDATGAILARTPGAPADRKRLGETGDPLERGILAEMARRSSGTLMGPGHPPEQVGGFFTLQQAPWTLVLFAPGDKILAPISTFRLYHAAASLLGIVAIILLLRLVVGSMVLSIRELSGAAERIAGGEYGDPLPVKSRDEIGQLTGSFNTMILGLKERDFISNTFGRYVDPEIARELMRRPEAGRLGGEKRQVAILMSDLRDFTPLAETRSPDLVLRILNRYFSRIIATIQQHRGIIVDFFGDALLVFFDPGDGPVGPAVDQAVRCALAMQAAMEQFNAGNRAEGLPELRMGIGVHAGEVVVGNIGSESRAKYGIVGAPVNLTQRIQAHAEGGEVIVTEAVRGALTDRLPITRQVVTRLKGVQESVTLYAVGGAGPPPRLP